jgi:hypothetical protein
MNVANFQFQHFNVRAARSFHCFREIASIKHGCNLQLFVLGRLRVAIFNLLDFSSLVRIPSFYGFSPAAHWLLKRFGRSDLRLRERRRPCQANQINQQPK